MKPFYITTADLKKTLSRAEILQVLVDNNVLSFTKNAHFYIKDSASLFYVAYYFDTDEFFYERMVAAT